MNLEQHIPAKRIREFLNGELPKPERDLVGLHLSYCLLCQKEQNEVLLEQANLELCGMANRSLTTSSAHIDPDLFARFWKGQITDTHQLEEISEHCLICEPCRQNRYQIWLHNRKGVEMRRHVTVIVGVLAAIDAAARRHNRKILPLAAVLVLFGSVFFFSGVGEALLSNAIVVASRSDEIPPIDLIDVRRVPVMKRSAPTIVVYKMNDDVRPDPLREVQSAMIKGPKFSGSPHAAAGKRPERLWEELTQVQRITLTNPEIDDAHRGANTKENQEKTPLPVVISRTETTGINIQLPEYSKHGKYLISLHRLGRMDTKLADDETETADGKELAVKLDLTNVLPGQYVLQVEREGEDANGKELLGYFDVFLIVATSDMEGR